MATKGTVSGVIANMVTLVVDGPVAQNEICYISTGGDKLMAEVIKVVGSHVYVQVFESTRGLKVGAEAEFTGHMLEVTLGPGMLSKNYAEACTMSPTFAKGTKCHTRSLSNGYVYCPGVRKHTWTESGRRSRIYRTHA